MRMTISLESRIPGVSELNLTKEQIEDLDYGMHVLRLGFELMGRSWPEGTPNVRRMEVPVRPPAVMAEGDTSKSLADWAKEAFKREMGKNWDSQRNFAVPIKWEVPKMGGGALYVILEYPQTGE